MSVFEPRTFSTDWEVMLIDRLERTVNMAKCDAFAGVLQAELDLPVHFDWNTIEFGMGINTSLEQFWQRTRQATDRAAELVGEYDLALFPGGAHPVEQLFNASHVHVGCIHDETAGIHLENQLMPYVPAFAALAANSPFWNRMVGGFKSHRVRHLAHGCTVPSPVRDPNLAQTTWGGDAAPKLYGVPTMEVRIIDCASSRRLLAEMATFIAAFLHHQGERVREERPTPQQYRDAMTNRWAAARHGMQATFISEGDSEPVAELLERMLEGCRDSLELLGAQRADLGLVNAMVRRRVCQADMALELAERYRDPYVLSSAYSKVVRRWDAFDRWLESAPTLEPAPAPDEEAVLAEHLAYVGEGTHFYRLREVMYYPPPASDAIIKRMVERGLITLERTDRRGLLLHRVTEQ